uniref:non-specific serine/threonine protein kinase n=1 Tax=Lutzomyia longipalpis TaxID=7200 RepID=A0A1B0GIE4_LUTLO
MAHLVEIHCLMNAGRCSVEGQTLPPGMPKYIASGSHTFGRQRYRFLILERYTFNLNSIVREHHVIDQKNILVIACQILDILQHLHDNGYAHSDIKAENLMIGKETKTIPATNGLRRGRNENHPNGMFEDGYSNHIPGKFVRRAEKITYNRLWHRLRPLKTINYCVDDTDSDSASNYSDDFDEETQWEVKPKARAVAQKTVTVDRIYLIDFGLASKFVDSQGVHRPFCIDQRRAHDGTLEFTSRDAHLGAHSRRSDLECLGYNLVYWSEGFLPWKLDSEVINQQQNLERVHHMKEHFMMDVVAMLEHVYGKGVPKYLGTYLTYVNNLTYCEEPDYAYCRKIFVDEFRRLGGGNTEEDMQLNLSEMRSNKAYEGQRMAKAIEAKIRDYKQRQENGLKETPSVHLKNLRSKKVTNGEKHPKASAWTDIVNTDPDLVVKDRTDREFSLIEDLDTPVVNKYRGRPTYAILEMERRILEKSLCADTPNAAAVCASAQRTKRPVEAAKPTSTATAAAAVVQQSPAAVRVHRRKSGLRAVIKPTRKSLLSGTKVTKKREKRQKKKLMRLINADGGKVAKRPATRSILKKMEDLIDVKGTSSEKRPTFRG